MTSFEVSLYLYAGISTDLLWKDHFIKGLKSREKVVRLGNFTSWRTEFFKRCFHVLIYEIASKGHVDVDQVLQGTAKNFSAKT